MKNKLLLILLTFLVLDASAFRSLYIGSTLGETDVKYVPADLGINTADIRYQGFSGRYFFGADLSKNFGVELSLLHAKKIGVFGINSTTNNGSINVNGYGLLAKFRIDINDSDVFMVKFGATYLRASPDNILRGQSTNHYSWQSVSHFRPTIELGINRRFFKYVDFGVSVHYLPEHRAIPRFMLIGFNLSIVIDKRFI